MSGVPADKAEVLARAALRGSRFADLRWVSETGSTNDDLVACASAGVVERVLVADHQTAGRGRRDRIWTSPPRASVMLSILTPRPAGHSPFWAVAAVSIAAVASIETVTGVTCSIKWPNDLLVGQHKVAGVLAQIVGDAAIVGIGINVDWSKDPSGLPATATWLERHRRPNEAKVDRVALVVALVQRAETMLATDPAELRRLWLARSSTIGQEVLLQTATGTATGTALDLADDGSLVVDIAGESRRFSAGDVVHLRPAANR